MAKLSRLLIKQAIALAIYTNTTRKVKGNTVRDKMYDIADSFLNIDSDANSANGYMAIDADGRANQSFIRKASPTGQFLRDDGTWQDASAGASELIDVLSLGNSTGGIDIVSPDAKKILTINDFYCQILGTDEVSSTGYVVASEDYAGVYHEKLSTGNANVDVRNGIVSINAAVKVDVSSPEINLNGSVKKSGDELATENFVNSAVSSAVVGLLDDRGNYDASSNLFPSSGGSGTVGAILKGDLWTISVGGTLGGVEVTAGDVVRALTNTPGQTAGNWSVTENNFGFVPEASSNKSSSYTVSSTTTYANTKALVDGLATKQNILGFTPEDVANKQNTLATDGTGTKFPTVDAVNQMKYASVPFGWTTATTLAANTTYYVGGITGLSAVNSDVPVLEFIAPITGYIKSINFTKQQGNSTPSNSPATLIIRNKTSSINSQAFNIQMIGQGRELLELTTPLGVTKGNSIQLRLTTPTTFVTAPTNVMFAGCVNFEND